MSLIFILLYFSLIGRRSKSKLLYWDETEVLKISWGLIINDFVCEENNFKLYSRFNREAIKEPIWEKYALSFTVGVLGSC